MSRHKNQIIFVLTLLELIILVKVSLAFILVRQRINFFILV